MIGSKERLGWLLAVVASLALVVLSLDPAPYRNVDVTRLNRVGDSIQLVATFEKTDCDFQRLLIVSGVAGETGFLNWSDLDGLGDDHDRNKGSQTLRIEIDLNGTEPDWVEVRTRHDCDGEKVDGVFVRVEPVPARPQGD